MIEVKLSTIVNGIEVLQKIANSPIKGRTAYKVAKLLKKLEEEFAIFNDSRKKMIELYTIKDENGEPIIEDGNYKIEPAQVKEFNEEVSSLLNTMITIDSSRIPLDELSEIEFTPSEIMLIEDFIEE